MSRTPAGRARVLCLVAIFAVGCSTQAPTASPEATQLPTAVPSATPAPTPTPTASPTAEPSPTAATVAPLDGLPTDPALANRLPLAVMIDDNVIARPQSGFNAASIVYQAPADGGEDRYMLVFQEMDAPDIGPVRSGRPYFVYWAAEYRSAFAHYGGDEKTLKKVIPPITNKLIYNLDALFGSGSAFHRIRSRKAPHNAYTSTADLYATANAKRYPTSMVGGLTNRLFADDAPDADRPAKGSITIPYGRGATGYTYVRATNSYLRSIAGKPHIDPMDKKQVVARNVVVLFMAYSIDPDSERGHARPVLAQIGKGTAWVFRDGLIIKGTWKKADQGALTRFFDAAGKEITLVRGRTFIQVVASGTKVTFDAKS